MDGSKQKNWIEVERGENNWTGGGGEAQKAVEQTMEGRSGWRLKRTQTVLCKQREKTKNEPTNEPKASAERSATGFV